MNIINGTQYPTDNPELAMALDRLRREGARVRITHRPANGAPIFQDVGTLYQAQPSRKVRIKHNRASFTGRFLEGDIISVRYANKRDGGVIWAAGDYKEECPTCVRIRVEHHGYGPSHNGSSLCRSGSIASGGNRAHCTCDACF